MRKRRGDTFIIYYVWVCKKNDNHIVFESWEDFFVLHYIENTFNLTSLDGYLKEIYAAFFSHQSLSLRASSSVSAKMSILKSRSDSRNTPDGLPERLDSTGFNWIAAVRSRGVRARSRLYAHPRNICLQKEWTGRCVAWFFFPLKV